MPGIIVKETNSGRRKGGSNSERTFYITGAVTEDEAFAEFLASPNVPLQIGNFLRANAQCDCQELEPGRYLGTAKYVSPEVSGQFQLPDSFNVSFDISGQTTRITQAIEHVATYPDSAERHYGAIGVTDEDTIEGTDIFSAQLSYVVNYTFKAADVNNDYINTLALIVGTVNNAPLHGYAAGELLLTRVSGQKRSDGTGDWDISFGFAVARNCKSGKRPNGLPFKIDRPTELGGALIIPEKEGWDYLWVYYGKEEIVDANGKHFRKVPVAAHIERVYLRTNFTLLGI